MAVESLLYLRQGELVVGPRVRGSNAPIEPIEARVFRTRLTFSVEKTDGADANKAKISIYNLSQASRDFLEQDDMVCFLKVGYEGAGLKTLFFGDLDQENGVHVERNGPDVITTIEAGDAEKVLRNANIQLGLAQGATNIQIIDAAIKRLNVSSSFRTQIKAIRYQNGFSYSGQVKKLLNDLGDQANFEWFIENGEIVFLSPEQTDQQEAVFLSKDTGLIGAPNKTKDKVEFISLLNTSIYPGRAVRLQSKIFSGQDAVDLKVKKATFEGDTDIGNWQTKVEAVAI